MVGAPVVLATVNIQNARVVSQADHTLSISFDISNRTGVQPSVRYSVQLVGVGTSTTHVVFADEYVFPDTVSLDEHTSVHKDIVYTAPRGLMGRFEVYIQAESDTGFPLATADAGRATFATAVSGVGIAANTCYLTVQGEKGSPKYTLQQGVDIASTEQLLLHCSATNYSGASVALTPQYETRYRSVYGDSVAQTGGDASPIVLAPHETKQFSLVLPKASEPQAYDVLFSLVSGNSTSNTIAVLYVLQGSSATIQNIGLDKSGYPSGDTAVVSFFWSPSADGSPHSRLGTSSPSATTAVITLQSGTTVCATPVTQPLTKNPLVRASLPVLAACANPQVTIKLLADDGTVLAAGGLMRTSATGNGLLLVEIVGALVLLLIMGGALVSVKRRADKK